MTPEVSFVVIAYNDEHGIRRCLSDIAAQCHDTCMEIVVAGSLVGLRGLTGSGR
jgi:glycosyltransferase involved in cell wall biosynthesis